MVKHVHMDPGFVLETANPKGYVCYDNDKNFDLQIGDLVHCKTPNGTYSYVVKSVTPADYETFDPTLNTVDLAVLAPIEKPVEKVEPTYAKWRTGRSVGRTIYAMSGYTPSDSDVLIGIMDTPALAEAAVEGHNAVVFAQDDPSLWREANAGV